MKMENDPQEVSGVLPVGPLVVVGGGSTLQTPCLPVPAAHRTLCCLWSRGGWAPEPLPHGLCRV